MNITATLCLERWAREQACSRRSKKNIARLGKPVSVMVRHMRHARLVLLHPFEQEIEAADHLADLVLARHRELVQRDSAVGHLPHIARRARQRPEQTRQRDQQYGGKG